jgi:phytoene desaturase
MKQVIVVGSGFAGLSAASFLARDGYQVTVLEQHGSPGGRARRFQSNGFTFDMGPSWYWMPDVFERYFAQFGKKVSDYYQLVRLDPSYRIYWPENETGPDGLNFSDIPADFAQLRTWFESLEPGSGAHLDQFMAEAAYKYEVGIKKLVFKPGQSLSEFLDIDLLKGVFKLDVFSSMSKHVHKHFKHPWLRQMMEFPVLFLGALAKDTPALYSLMNYADIKLGTWYPENGMYSIVEGMYKLAQELGVRFAFHQKVEQIVVDGKSAKKVVATNTTTQQTQTWEADVVIGGADYHFMESKLLDPAFRSYSEAYWEKRVMAPSCLIYYVGLNKKLPGIQHHSLFFDTSFDQHAEEIYTSKKWPEDPLFYLSATSVTDPTAAPEGSENLFFLIPIAAGLQNDTEELREMYFDRVLTRLEKRLGTTVRDAIVFKRSFAPADFIQDYNAFKGNAYGLANTLLQTAVLKPSCRSKKVQNLFYTGQLTVPGPGVPPSLISGEVVAGEVKKYF